MKCCDRDTDEDGNCDVHSAPGKRRDGAQDIVRTVHMTGGVRPRCGEVGNGTYHCTDGWDKVTCQECLVAGIMHGVPPAQYLAFTSRVADALRMGADRSYLYPRRGRDDQGVEHWYIALNRYQRDNLVWLMNLAGYPYIDNGLTEPFNLLNTGDWLGEIHNILTLTAPRDGDVPRPNKTVDEMRQRIGEWLSAKIKDAREADNDAARKEISGLTASLRAIGNALAKSEAALSRIRKTIIMRLAAAVHHTPECVERRGDNKCRCDGTDLLHLALAEMNDAPPPVITLTEEEGRELIGSDGRTGIGWRVFDLIRAGIAGIDRARKEQQNAAKPTS